MTTKAGGLSIEGISKRFGEALALSPIDLEVPAGSFFSLLGPSGCGKTTLLRIIAGLESPDGGAVVCDGVDVTSTPPEKRPFNMVFQNYALFPHMTVAENVAFGLTTASRRIRPSAEERQERVVEMLKLVGLTEFGRRYPSELSGGQAQRVAVARALINRPSVLLLDEPLSALDRNIRLSLREELQRIHQELGATFIFVTHDQEEALSISELVGVMQLGRLEQVGTPEDIYRSPATFFTASFIGAGSFVPAEVLAVENDLARVRVASREFHAVDAGVRAGGSARVLLRPEELELAEGGVPGEVDTAAFFGSYFEVVVGTSLGLLRLHLRHPQKPGASVSVGWSSAAGIAYPSGSESWQGADERGSGR